ncbi:hypothetical protein AGLY_009640 [Aphis glycines]|uniref:Uncharacterized protein n=1 Tax=Aphis glycines TaxID=307491 RepID=A0A6G0TH11_APHGL|nr:hypothetical protein AGLY_009640 [Aphis glycines]
MLHMKLWEMYNSKISILINVKLHYCVTKNQLKFYLINDNVKYKKIISTSTKLPSKICRCCFSLFIFNIGSTIHLSAKFLASIANSTSICLIKGLKSIAMCLYLCLFTILHSIFLQYFFSRHIIVLGQFYSAHIGCRASFEMFEASFKSLTAESGSDGCNISAALFNNNDALPEDPCC